MQIIEDVLWDRRGPERRALRTEAFRLLAAVGRRTSDGVAGSLMRSRIVRNGTQVKVECDSKQAPTLAAAEKALAEAVREIFGPASRLVLVGCGPWAMA